MIQDTSPASKSMDITDFFIKKRQTKERPNERPIFDEELLEFFGNPDSVQNIKSKIKETTFDQCEHASCFDEKGISICKNCGCEVEQLDFEPEWRYYGTSDNRISKDPSRCHKSKEPIKGNINKVFEDAKLTELPQAIKKMTEKKYKIIVDGDTVRGKGRKARVAACLLHVLREEGDIRTSDDIRNMFALTKQQMSEGLTVYYTAFPKDRTQHANPSDFIRKVLQQIRLDFDHYKYILKIAHALNKVDQVLNRSSPHSVASAIVYLYICLHPELKEKIGLTKPKFAKAVNLSDITITKLVKRSAECLQLDNLSM